MRVGVKYFSPERKERFRLLLLLSLAAVGMMGILVSGRRGAATPGVIHAGTVLEVRPSDIISSMTASPGAVLEGQVLALKGGREAPKALRGSRAEIRGV